MLGRQWGSPGRTSFGHCGFLPASAELLRKVYLAGWLAGWQFLYRLSAGSALTQRDRALAGDAGFGGSGGAPGWPGVARGPRALRGRAGTGRGALWLRRPRPPRRALARGARSLGRGCWCPALGCPGPRCAPGSLRAPDLVSQGLLPPGSSPGGRCPRPATLSGLQAPSLSPWARRRRDPLSGRQNRWFGLTPPFPLPSTLLERMPRKSSHHQTTTTFSHYY